MRILCCLDGTNSEEIGKTATLLNTNEPQVYGLLYVIDTEPRREIERTRERFMRRPSGPLAPRQERIRQAEQASAQDILNEGLRYFPGAETIQRTGRPEREIVNCAAEWNADIILILPRANYGEPPTIGPKSVGHVARFVLDHAPCPVFLARPIARGQFPLPR
ncbi:MAG TPA: universal stress protein [Ktedonobacteraceae bacterium]|jgi:nucleotide-binding universal stress UspA family protein|nr:universal stress protein [Ktedonobacteraceae bacterium]